MDYGRARDLFGEAIDIARAERNAWLIAACGDDHALRAEVERMLRIDAKATTFLEAPRS